MTLPSCAGVPAPWAQLSGCLWALILACVIELTICLQEAVSKQEDYASRVEISPGGFLDEHRPHHNSRGQVPRTISAPVTENTLHTQLCQSLKKAMEEKRCARRGVAVFQEQTSNLKAAREWPVRDCQLPRPLFDTLARAESPCTVTFANSAANAENIWALLPPGGLLVVPLKRVVGDSFLHSDLEKDPEGFIWQALYQVHSNLYFAPVFGEDFKKRLGLPQLQFVTFFAGHALLQKADWSLDLHAANGTFWTLAKGASTDKVDRFHNYSLLYHRHLDEAGVVNELGGMMLEIGLGCVLGRGDASLAGKSAKVWPRLLPNVAVHFLEIDRECVANWQPQMRELGVARVHIGAQADPEVLAEIIHDAKFARPGGFCSVVDDGSHNAADIEASLRTLFPHLKSGGLYFVEDVMYSAWPTYKAFQALPSMNITSKRDHSSATPVAVAAVLAAAATGLAEGSAEALQQNAMLSPNIVPSRPFFGRIVDALRAASSYVLEPFMGRDWLAKGDTYPVPSFRYKEKWRQEILSSHGALVDLVECTPGICVFRRK